MTENMPCIQHEEQIQENARKIAELGTEVRFKKKRIDDLYIKMEKMETKIDNINENVNKIVQSSIQSDNALEIRLAKIETDMKNQKDEQHRKLVWIGIGLTIITIMINIYFNIIN